MLSENNKTLEYNHGERPLKVLLIIPMDIECILEKEHSCQNNSKKILHREKSKACTFRLLM